MIARHQAYLTFMNLTTEWNYWTIDYQSWTEANKTLEEFAYTDSNEDFWIDWDEFWAAQLAFIPYDQIVAEKGEFSVAELEAEVFGSIMPGDLAQWFYDQDNDGLVERGEWSVATYYFDWFITHEDPATETMTWEQFFLESQALRQQVLFCDWNNDTIINQTEAINYQAQLNKWSFEFAQQANESEGFEFAADESNKHCDTNLNDMIDEIEFTMCNVQNELWSRYLLAADPNSTVAVDTLTTYGYTQDEVEQIDDNEDGEITTQEWQDAMLTVNQWTMEWLVVVSNSTQVSYQLEWDLIPENATDEELSEFYQNVTQEVLETFTAEQMIWYFASGYQHEEVFLDDYIALKVAFEQYYDLNETCTTGPDGETYCFDPNCYDTEGNYICDDETDLEDLSVEDINAALLEMDIDLS